MGSAGIATNVRLRIQRACKWVAPFRTRAPEVIIRSTQRPNSASQYRNSALRRHPVFVPFLMVPMRRSIVGLTTLLIAAACHSDRTQGPPGEPGGTLTIIVDHVSGTSTGDTLVVGDFANFSLMGADSVVPKDPIEWTVSDTTVVGIVDQIAWAIGLQARRPGHATLTVKYQVQTGTHDLVVRNARASDSACAVVQGLDSITTTVGDTVSV